MTTAITSTDPAGESAADSAAEAAGEAGSADAVSTLRGQIDALDAAIIDLVAERARLSARIQTARMNGGGTRVELGRERVILASYRRGLGSQGPHLADAVLQVCRGER